MEMSQNERLDYLIKYLCAESEEYKNIEAEAYEKHVDRRQLLRALMNVREPKNISDEFLKIQDKFLKYETELKGITNFKDIETIAHQYGINNDVLSKISIWQGDITTLKIDAIVNAVNSEMLGCFVPNHRCIDNAIHYYSGIELRFECYQYMNEKRIVNQYYKEPTGSAVVTKGYNLPCKNIIHTVGPIVYDELNDELEHDLESCYLSCLNEALKNNIRSIAFCCISTGEFHFPNERAAEIAVSTCMKFIKENNEKIDRIVFNVFKDYDLKIYDGFFRKL